MRLISQEKVRLFREKLREKNVDVALFLTSEPIHDVNIEYFTGFQQARFFSFSCLLIDEERMILMVSSLSYDRAIEEAEADEVINLAEYKHSLSLALKEKLKDAKTVGVVERIFPFKLSRKLQGLKFVDISDITLELRSIKERKEIEMIRRACRIADHGIKFIERNLSTKLREKDLALMLEQELMRKGADELAFPTIVTSGKRSAFIHPYPSFSDERITDGLGLVDFGVRFRGYCSDVTVPFSIGRLNEKQKRILDTVSEAYEEAIDTLELGVPTWKVHERVESGMRKRGFKLKHGTGHGLGLELHDLPSFSRKPERKEDLEDWEEVRLKEKMVFTIEPGIYEVGTGGVRLENDVLMRKKPRILTHSSVIQL